ncbi:hypothetical protein [Nocardia terpenica]|uniref:hypothetical protein n=1 Tax=Nocardia terpenica TaxID=455432 RepID=UPI0012E89F5E|nr:hypothetical protein [Nocardia terpenica]NQE89729.1 hypothetical protein [Nocardia terpenica]
MSPSELTFTPPTADSVIVKVREIAAGAPDNIYAATTEDGTPVCAYVLGGEGSCLIGKALVALGVPLAVFEQRTVSGKLFNTRFIDVPEWLALLGWDNGTQARWLHCVQAHQDCDVPWGTAIEYADRKATIGALSL